MSPRLIKKVTSKGDRYFYNRLIKIYNCFSEYFNNNNYIFLINMKNNLVLVIFIAFILRQKFDCYNKNW